jgi:hypothetical protein
VRLEGLGQLKNPMTSSGIEPEQCPHPDCYYFLALLLMMALIKLTLSAYFMALYKLHRLGIVNR